MANPCPTCLPIDCDLTEDFNLYSIQTPLFPWIINCPPGFSCQGSDTFKMVCCGQLLQVDFPPGATVDDKQSLMQELVNQCGVRQLYCNGDIPQNPPDNPTQLFYNGDRQCTVFCPDGSPFVFITFAGTFASTTQADADKQASNYACQQAGLRKLCLGPIPSCTCVGSAFTATISHTGGIPPFTWSVFSGALPDGLTMNGAGVISGTPTTNGSFTFTIQVTAADRSYMRKQYSISVLEITTTSLPAYSIGTPYSYQLQVAGGSGNYAWRIVSGTLPNGLTMSQTGLISGTPV